MRDNEIVLYNGSLNELNSRDDNVQYSFVTEREFVSNVYRIKYDNSTTIERKVKDELRNLEYDGVVNKRTIIFARNMLWEIPAEGIIEGTPIKRAKTNS